ncbi:hypothetical protein CtesDRAFT_PD1131 [Comamonas testosteroni KF-1]|jgi:hypothetical protein|uniref:Uncharacterized protein n=1 Tax=Comamonas testosteroni (strain DSM 14576 / KF-1) TaxID=399795 RepID=B7WZE4_COMTK|nr:hypothetical protein CtesDRAFT_PD1131 [Comamonas testosteroni KF-1]
MAQPKPPKLNPDEDAEVLLPGRYEISLAMA